MLGLVGGFWKPLMHRCLGDGGQTAMALVVFLQGGRIGVKMEVLELWTCTGEMR